MEQSDIVRTDTPTLIDLYTVERWQIILNYLNLNVKISEFFIEAESRRKSFLADFTFTDCVPVKDVPASTLNDIRGVEQAH